MSAKKVITIDFWNTLVNASTNGDKRHQSRYNALKVYCTKYGVEISATQLNKAMKEVSEAFDKVWLGEQRTPLTHELVRQTIGILQLPLNETELSELTRAFQESLYDGPPELAPEIHKALAAMAEKTPLGIISDTMFSPGVVLREFLNREGLLQYFSHFVFSDEVGFSKPNVQAFQRIINESKADAQNSWHIGDIQPTDILGANNSGMNSLLYIGLSDKYKEGNSATKVSADWLEIADVLG